MAGRRVLSISLPMSDPAAAAIEAWLATLPDGADVSAEARRLLALALDLRGPLERIEGQLARLASGAPPAAAGQTPAPAEDAEAAAALDRLFDFSS